MGILAEPTARAGDTYFLQQIDGALLGFFLPGLLVAKVRLHHLIADGVGRIQGGHRLLEDHHHAIAANVGHLPLRHGSQIDVPEQQPIRRSGSAGGQQIHDRQRCNGLAAAGLADDAKRLPLVHTEVDAAHRVQFAGAHRDVYSEVLNLEY